MRKHTTTVEVKIALVRVDGLPNALSVMAPRGIVAGEGGEIFIDEWHGVPPSDLVEAVRPELPEGCQIIMNSRDEIWLSHPDASILKTLDGRQWRVRYVSSETINSVGDVVAVEEGAILVD